jgi:hypothetical protein
VLGAMLEAAASESPGRLCIDHADLPAAAWERVIPHFGFEAVPAVIESMIKESRYYSKDPSPRVFAGDVPERRPVTRTIREAAERFAEPCYRALASDG